MNDKAKLEATDIRQVEVSCRLQDPTALDILIDEAKNYHIPSKINVKIIPADDHPSGEEQTLLTVAAKIDRNNINTFVNFMQELFIDYSFPSFLFTPTHNPSPFHVFVSPPCSPNI